MIKLKRCEGKGKKMALNENHLFFYFPLLLHNLSSNTEWAQGSTHEWGSIRKEKIVQ